MSWSSAAHPGDMHGASASTAREPAAYDGLGLASFDPSHLSPTSTWRDLSDGGYSEVYRARMLGAPVAVKQATNRKKTSGDALLREIKYLQLAGAHPNIVSVYGAFSERGKLHLVLEYAVCLRTDRVARACDPILVVSGIARALVRLHGNGIIHRDLKVRKRVFFYLHASYSLLLTCRHSLAHTQARNVLIAHDNRPMLIDFGLACHTGLDAPEWIRRTVGTKKYRPPEMGRDGGRPAHPSMDIYCVGLLIEKLLKQRRERDEDERDNPPQQSHHAPESSHRRSDDHREQGHRRSDDHRHNERDSGRVKYEEPPSTSRGGRNDSGRDGRENDRSSRGGGGGGEPSGALVPRSSRDQGGGSSRGGGDGGGGGQSGRDGGGGGGGNNGGSSRAGDAGGGPSRGGGGGEGDKYERRVVRLLGELASQCTSREPQDRPTAWGLLMRLQRFLGDSQTRCTVPRQNIPLSALTATQMLDLRERAAARDERAEEEDGRGGGGRKRRREDDGNKGSSRHGKSSKNKRSGSREKDRNSKSRSPSPGREPRSRAD